MTEAEKIAQTTYRNWCHSHPDEAAALIREQEQKIKRLSEALRGFATPKQSHYECEDAWYSCPKHEGYAKDDGQDECTCGADEHNAKLERHADALRDAGVSE